MAYGIRIIIDFIYGNEHHQRSWAAAPVSFKGRKGAEECVLLHGTSGDVYRMDDSDKLSDQLHQGADDFVGLRCIGGCGGSGAALRQEQKCSIGGKAAGGGICGAWHGGIIYWVSRNQDFDLFKQKNKQTSSIG